MLRLIYKIVMVDKQVTEPFSAQSLAPYMPRFDRERISAYLIRHAAHNPRSQTAIFVRFYRGQYRFNRKVLEDREMPV